METKIKTQFQNIINVIEKKLNIKRDDKGPIDLMKYYYHIEKSNINSKQKYIINILKIFSYSNGQINFINKNYQIFYLKFLENSIKILEDKYCEDSPGIIINSKDLETLGKDKDLILNYIELSLLYENEALKLFFCFLNKKMDSLKFKFLEIEDSDDITNINQLQKIYQLTLRMLKDSMKNKKINNPNKKQIIIIENKIKEKSAKKDQNIKEDIKIKEKPSSLNIKEDKSSVKTVNNNNKAYSILNTIDKNKKGFTNTESEDGNLQAKKDIKCSQRETTEIKVNKNIQILNIKTKDDNNKNKNTINNNNNKRNEIKKNNNNENNKKLIGKLNILNKSTNGSQQIIPGQNKNNNEMLNKTENIYKKSEKIIRAKSHRFKSIKKNIKNFNFDNQNGKSETKIKYYENNNIKFSKKNIIELQKGLFTKTIEGYLKDQKEKYLKSYEKNDILNNNNFPNCSFSLNFHSCSNSNFILLKSSAIRIKNYFNNQKEVYKENYGFCVLNNIAYFYCDDLDDKENAYLFDSEIIKKCNYDKELPNDPISYGSYSGTNISDPQKEKNIDYYLFTGMNFEKNWVMFFDINFKLKHLPSKFFSVKIIDKEKKNNNNNKASSISKYSKIHPYNKYKFYNNIYRRQYNPIYYNYSNKDNNKLKKKISFIQKYPSYKNNKFDQINPSTNLTAPKVDITSHLATQQNLDNIQEEIKFGEYIKNLFKVYIETDCARINLENENKYYDLSLKPFFEYIPIEIKKANNGDWTIEEKGEDEKRIIIFGKSIILAETKISAPENKTHIKLDDMINKKNIQNYLYFVIYKLAKKITYYKELFINEYLKEGEDINSYKFQLFLVYDNKPFSNLNYYIKECLKNLINDKLIENEFIIQAIYAIPTISTYNSNYLEKIIDNNEKIIKQLQKSDIEKKNEIKNLKIIIEANKKEIIDLKNSDIAKNDEIKQLKDKVEKLLIKIGKQDKSGKL